MEVMIGWLTRLDAANVTLKTFGAYIPIVPIAIIGAIPVANHSIGQNEVARRAVSLLLSWYLSLCFIRSLSLTQTVAAFQRPYSPTRLRQL